MIIFDDPPREPDEKEIFIDDVDRLVLRCYPDHEGQHPIFEKFGMRTGGMYDTWLYTKDWRQLPEIEKWKYVALCSLYWESMYEYRYNQREYAEYKNHLWEMKEKHPELSTEILKTLKYLQKKEQRH